MKRILIHTAAIAALMSLYGACLAVDGEVFITKNYNLADVWYNTRSESVPRITTTQEAFQEQFFIVGVFYSQYKLGADNSVDLSYDLEIKRPDGSVYFSQKEIPGAKRQVEDATQLIKADGEMRVNLEKTEPMGEYTINVRLKDNTDGSAKSVSKTVRIVRYVSGKPFKTDEDLMALVNNYYREPDAGRLLDGYLYYAGSKLTDNEKAFVPVFSFFVRAFNDNEYLQDEVMRIFPEQDETTRLYLVWLLHYTSRDNSAFLKKLRGTDKKMYVKAAEKPYVPDPYGRIEDPAQLDALWGEFLASGSYKPVHRIIEVLEYWKYAGALEAYKTSKKSAQDRENAMKEAILQSAVWSLGSQCKQSELVREYCYFALVHDKNLPETSRSLLKKIIQKSLEKDEGGEK